MEQFNKGVRDITNKLYLTNEYVSAGLVIFFIVYASMAAPKLPHSVASLFDRTWFRFLVFFAIAYMAKQNATVALVAAIAVMVTIQAADRLHTDNEIRRVLQEDTTFVSSQVGGKSNDYRDNFYPKVVAAKKDTLGRDDNVDDVSGYEDSLFANYESD